MQGAFGSVKRAVVAFTLALAVASSAAGTHPPAQTLEPLPARLSDARLFVAGSTAEVRPELVPFAPQYPLWSDGTTKRRWLELPPGAAVDAADPNAWDFPPGTRFFKEFALDRRIETRIIERLADGTWRFGVYIWNDDESDAMLAPAEGVRALAVAAAPGGRYTIPSEYDCRACHEGGSVPVLGFSALQLSPDRDPLAPHAAAQNAADLRTLVHRGLLRNLPLQLLVAPPRIAAASPLERAALGYLHGNCGHCHVAPSAEDPAVPVGVRLAQAAGDAAQSASLLRTLLGAPTRFRPLGTAAGEPAHAVVPGEPERSVLLLRMRSRDPYVQMPPLGTAIPDVAGLALIERWIVERRLLESQTIHEEQPP